MIRVFQRITAALSVGALLLRWLKRGDTSGDLRLSFKEVVEARMRFFDAADFDKDERLSMAEVISYDAQAIRRAHASVAK